MPGVLLLPSAHSVGASEGMKRARAEESSAPTGVKKRKVNHEIQHAQPVHHIVEHTSAELDSFGVSKDFFDEQLRRAIAIECKAIGFDTARPDALEEFRALTESYMMNMLSQVRKSMTSSRRTETIAHDWVYALSSTGLHGSGALEQHLDTGTVPKSLLQPHFEAPTPKDPEPISTESLLGSELSGRADKEARAYIPKHFPPFPSKNTYTATAVYAKRENDPRKIREKATEEGIRAEQTLRALMAAKKTGLQKRKAGKRKRSEHMKKSDTLWQDAMTNLLEEEKQREEKQAKHTENQMASQGDDYNFEAAQQGAAQQPVVERVVNLEEGVHVNYGQKFWRKSARGG